MAITFSAGDRRRTVDIPLICDTVVEGTETFSMTLSLNVANPRVQIGTQGTATGIIEDSTGW